MGFYLGIESGGGGGVKFQSPGAPVRPELMRI